MTDSEESSSIPPLGDPVEKTPNTQDIAQKIVEGITDAMKEISEGKESSLNSVFTNMRILKQCNLLPSVGPNGFTSLFEALALEDKKDFDIYLAPISIPKDLASSAEQLRKGGLEILYDRGSNTAFIQVENLNFKIPDYKCKSTSPASSIGEATAYSDSGSAFSI